MSDEQQNQTLTECAHEETTLLNTTPHNAHTDALSQRVSNLEAEVTEIKQTLLEMTMVQLGQRNDMIDIKNIQ